MLVWKIDRIVHSEVWATDDIPADLPPMVEFKKKADTIIKERWGIEEEHLCAMRYPKNEENFRNPPIKNVGGVQIHIREILLPQT